MRYFLATTAVWLTLLPAGCRLPGSDGPVPSSLAKCRQLSRRGIAAAERGQHERAEKLLANAVEACPVDHEARSHYAETLWQRGNRKAAVAQLVEAGRLADDAMLRVRLAEMQLAMGQMRPARENVEQALDLDPRLSEAWAIRGRVMQAGGQLRQALADYHRALAYAPDNSQILLEIAEVHRHLNEPQRALATLHSLAASYSPGEEPQQVHDLLGMAYVAMGRYEDGVESFSAAASREKPTADILYRLAEAQFLAGRPMEATAAAHDALRLMPTHQASRDLLGRIETAGRPPAVLQR